MNAEESTTEAVREYLASAPGSLLAGRDVRVAERWQGADNLLWRVDAEGAQAVAKLYLDAGWVRGRRQHDAHLAFAPLGLAPQPLWFDREPEGLKHQVVVYAYAPGREPDTASSADMDAIGEAIAAVHWGGSASIARIAPHPLTLTTFGAILEAGVQGAQKWIANARLPGLAEAFADLASAAFRVIDEAAPLWQGAAPVPIHGDLILENMLADGGRVLFLDWELCGLGDPSLETARFLTATPFADESARERWLSAYLKRSGSALLARRIAIYRTLLPFEYLVTILTGVREHGAELDDGDRSDLLLLLDTLFTRAAMVLGRPPADIRDLPALLRPTV